MVVFYIGFRILGIFGAVSMWLLEILLLQLLQLLLVALAILLTLVATDTSIAQSACW